MGNEGLLAGLACRSKSRDNRPPSSRKPSLGQAVGRFWDILGEDRPQDHLFKVFGSAEKNVIWVLRVFGAQAGALSIVLFLLTVLVASTIRDTIVLIVRPLLSRREIILVKRLRQYNSFSAMT